MNLRRLVLTLLILTLVFSSALNAGVPDGKPVDEATFRAYRAFYDYDKQVPLDVKIAEDVMVERSEEIPKHRRITLSLVNNHDERVPGILWLPLTPGGPRPCIFFLHGLNQNKASAGRYALDLLRAGYATLALDAAYHGDRAAGKQPMHGTTFYRLRDGHIQTVVDYRRALDYLETRNDIDSKRITLIGVSMGGIMGAVLGGVETRIKCPVLLVAGADRGLMSRVSQIEVWRRIRADNPGLDFSEISRITAPADPMNFVNRISPRPLLMINGTKDEIVPVVSNKLLHRRAKQPKKVVWLEAGHSLPKEQCLPILLDWFKNHL